MINRLLIFIIILLFTSLFTSCASTKYDSFAECLTEKGAVMYGTDWCPHCKSQKKMFGGSFKYVDYVNCDLNKGECIKEGIEGYPTWIINDTSYRGEQPLLRLGFLTGCKLPE